MSVNFHTFIYFKYTRLKNHKKLSFLFEDFKEFSFVLSCFNIGNIEE